MAVPTQSLAMCAADLLRTDLARMCSETTLIVLADSNEFTQQSYNNKSIANYF